MALWDKTPSSYGGKPFTITWSDGTQTVRPDLDIGHKPSCACCSSETHIPEHVQFGGLCRPCFAENGFGVPGKVAIEGQGEFIWLRPVQATRDWKPPYSFGMFNSRPTGADRYGHNFGIGDKVLHRPRDDEPSTISEGTVLSLHEYAKAPIWSADKHGNTYFGAKIFFGKDRTPFLNAADLEALTCEAVEFDTSEFDRALGNIQIKSAKLPDNLREVFDRPIARAIWSSYRMNHLCDDSDIVKLTNSSLQIAKEIEGLKMSYDRMHIWFSKRFRETGLKMEQNQIAALTPYLNGQKTAKYSLNAA